MNKIISLLALAITLLSCGPAFHTTGSETPADVNIGYGTMPADQITSDISTVKVDENVPYTTIYEMIQGKCAGVQVSGSNIVIRGISTINLSSQPLFVVDGIEMDDISHIHPRDVKAIHVLKGSSASIYGSRGANGVILITLK